MESPPASSNAVESFDSSRPFQGLVLCCTSIEADQRSEIAQRTADMGGIHKYDLTPDVTHLIVGDYNTAKYRHVAKERPDIKCMAAGWVDTVRQLWVEDQEIDFAALESRWMLQPFESSGGIPNSPVPAERERKRLVCCLTGFEDNNVRAMIEDKVKANGGEYVADLSKRVTHLIVFKPEGKKYNAARRWEIRCVSIEWLHDSIERGMILNEECYDPTLPAEERGKGAWSRREVRRVSLGKRARDGPVTSTEEGRRKLRKSASMRMNSQSVNIWGDILNQSAVDPSRADGDQRESSAPAAPVADSATSAIETSLSVKPYTKDDNLSAVKRGVFSGCRFFVHGFPKPREQILFDFLTSHGGQLSLRLDDVASLSHDEPLDQRYLLVPQSSQPDSHPQLPDRVHIITEFFIERCIHNKTLFSPRDHVWGQPFPRFPIDRFQTLTICTAGFINEQLNQIEKTVIQLGATYSEKLNREVSLLVCPGLSSLREQKRDLAILHNIPIVNVEWLWQCITTGCLVPWQGFQFEELTHSADSIRAKLKQKEEVKRGKGALHRSRSEPVVKKLPPPKTCRRAPPSKAGLDTTAFDDETPGAGREVSSLQKQDTHESYYETAPTHPTGIDNAFASAPLSETTASNLNKPSLSPKQPQRQHKLNSFPTEGEVGDSEAGEESDATTKTVKESACCDSETDRKRKAQHAKDLERVEMSKRLNSLMSNADASQEGSIFKPQPGSLSRPHRRRREILGRATSNVSTASSASADSASASASKIPQLGSMLNTSASGGSEFDKFFEPGEEHNMAGAGSPPPATQLEYDNPEARQCRKAVVSRLLGNKRVASETVRQSQEKIRLVDLDPGAAEISTTRRMTRRQGRE
ncbi:hypothetical protein F5Y19DRAFT_231520 [Xylariaceae sp. FL1651]|nr:hypothetical protein F5Y19DRAFT_231520 [Xylariaceae sp. FL1651]